nr:type III pantothenate kinase [Membranihabitans maritimus]
MAIDIGNTVRKLGLFHSDNLETTIIVNENEWSKEVVDNIVNKFNPDTIIFSSTSDLEESDFTWIRRYGAWEVKSTLNFPFSIHYTTPQTLGQDRLAAVSAVFALYNGKSVLVIDAGTCITYDFITAGGDYIGGNITPGLYMRLKAMHQFTDRLPLVEYTDELSLLGNSTKSALQNGGIRMAIMEAEAFIRELEVKYGELKVILTGGDHKIFAKYLKTKIFAHPDLILFGLNEISKYNEY